MPLRFAATTQVPHHSAGVEFIETDARYIAANESSACRAEGGLVDFTEALRSRIESMSPDELAATEVRRRSREAERGDGLTLDGLWEPASGDAAVTKAVTIRVETGTPGTPDILRIDQGTAFHESVLLSPPAYRLIAGGIEADGAVSNDRYTVLPGGPGSDTVSLGRAELAAIVAGERPVEMARSRRLVALEQRPPAIHLPVAERIAQFAEKWTAEIVNARVDAVVSKVASRAVMLLTGRDHVALWVRRDDLIVGPDRILGSSLAAAIVRPDGARSRPTVLVPGSNAATGDAFLKNSFGSGPERTLILDVAQIRKLVAAMQSEDAREAAVLLFDRLVHRSAAIGRERLARGKTSALRDSAAQS